MACANHSFARTEELMSDSGGALCILLEDEELFLDAETCARCGAAELVLHGDAAKLRGTFDDEVGACPRCGAPAVGLGFEVCSQGGTEIHVPLDDRWTFGLVSSACANGHVTVARVGGGPAEGAPRNADLLARHPNVGSCERCGGNVHATEVESHHSGVVRVDDRALLAHICASCERVRLFVADVPA
jgi:ribosomal protein S27AE